jgi:hypothetical protein
VATIRGRAGGQSLDLSGRLKRGAYRAKPVKRTCIPKEDGRQRPIGVTALEDKIVQRTVVEVLEAIYETDFSNSTLNETKRKPDSSSFLGFTHLCGQKRKGKFVVLRHTMRKRVRRKCKELKKELRRRMLHPIPAVGRWLKSVLRGHYNYYGVPRNGRAMNAFSYDLGRLWFKTLRRRSQKSRVNWDRMARIIERYLPYPKIRHPYPEQRMRVITQGRSPVR